MPRHRDRFRCPRCTHLETWTFYEPLVSGTLFGACHAGGTQENLEFSGSSLSGIISTAPCIWQSLVRCILDKTVSCSSSPLEYKSMEFSGRRLLVCFPCSVLFGSTVDTCLASVYEALWLPHCRNWGFSAVAVHRRSSAFVSFRRGRSHGPDDSTDHRDSPVAVRFQVVDSPVVRVVQFLLCCRGDVLGAPTVAAR